MDNYTNQIENQFKIMDFFYEFDHSLIIAVDFRKNEAFNPDGFKIDKHRKSRHNKIMVVIMPNPNQPVNKDYQTKQGTYGRLRATQSF